MRDVGGCALRTSSSTKARILLAQSQFAEAAHCHCWLLSFDRPRFGSQDALEKQMNEHVHVYCTYERTNYTYDPKVWAVIERNHEHAYMQQRPMKVLLMRNDAECDDSMKIRGLVLELLRTCSSTGNSTLKFSFPPYLSSKFSRRHK